MIWLIYVSIIALVLALVILRTSRRTENTVVNQFDVPTIIDRKDFSEYKANTMVIVFSSRVCDSCSSVLAKAAALQSDAVDVVNVEFEDKQGKELHSKYEIQAVPTTVICQQSGEVLQSFIGPVSATDLWAASARARGDEISTCSNH